MTSTYTRQPTTSTPAPPADLPVAPGGVPTSADGVPADQAGIPGLPPDATVRITPSAPATMTEPRPASTGRLVSDVAADVSTLFRQEIALAKAELRAEATKAGKGAGMFAGAGGAGYFALLFVLLAVMFGLGEVMALGWAALIVGVVLAAVAAVLALRGRSTVREVHPAPTQTVETLREDVQWAQSRRH
ncbi:phage holin family protein [Parafrankia discariae]|uniref:phage holin family protein n=1 Tax=Parafrankia discariae TaxID=365528 RepID=UPI000363C66A|nr:phage holin family protein [Parafrankia discariae]